MIARKNGSVINMASACSNILVSSITAYFAHVALSYPLHCKLKLKIGNLRVL